MNWWEKYRDGHTDLWVQVTIALTMLVKCNLPGKVADIDDPEIIAFYVADCLHLRVTAQEIAANMEGLRRGYQYFPRSTEFADRVFQLTGRSLTGWNDNVWLIDDQGELRCASKSALPPGRRYFNTEAEALAASPKALESKPKALPSPREQRKIMARQIAERAKMPDYAPDPEHEKHIRAQADKLREVV